MIILFEAPFSAGNLKKNLDMTDRSFIFVFSIEENEQRGTYKTNDH